MSKNFKEKVIDFLYFGIKQAKAALFAGMFLALIFVSNYISIPGIYRYDFLFIGAIFLQIFLLVFKLETKDEAKTILLFHIVGLVLELYKTHPMVGSWSYPEPGYLKIFNVPLYSGFMYAAVGSYIAGSWKTLKLKLIRPPKYWHSVVLCFFIYLNFFTNHFMWDYRWILFIVVFAFM